VIGVVHLAVLATALDLAAPELRLEETPEAVTAARDDRPIARGVTTRRLPSTGRGYGLDAGVGGAT